MSADEERIRRELEAARAMGALEAQVRSLDASIRDGTTRIEQRLDTMSEAFVSKATFGLFRAVVFGIGGAALLAAAGAAMRAIFG